MNHETRTPPLWAKAWPAAPLLLLLLTGCGDDRPYRNSDHPQPQQVASNRSAAMASTSESAAPDRAPDPLVGDKNLTPQDPLLGQDPLIGEDPLIKSSPLGAGAHDPMVGHSSLQGQGMPTEHSHWIQCHLLRDARVTVLLNGVRYRSYSGAMPGDDITMKLRRGVNTVTFEYEPQGPGAAADLSVVESEHHPDIAPLATFQKASAPEASGDRSGEDPPKLVRKTVSFVAN